MDYRLELVPIPVSDVDRARAFYAEKVEFNVDLDVNASTDHRAKQTSKAIDSKVRYDSLFLTWMKSMLEETHKPDRISTATIRTGPTSK